MAIIRRCEVLTTFFLENCIRQVFLKKIKTIKIIKFFRSNVHWHLQSFFFFPLKLKTLTWWDTLQHMIANIFWKKQLIYSRYLHSCLKYGTFSQIYSSFGLQRDCSYSKTVCVLTHTSTLCCLLQHVIRSRN